MNVFFDTNILVDVLLERQPFYGDSAQVWSLAHDGRISGFVSVLSYPNVHYVIRRLADARRADKAVRAIHGSFRTVPLDEQILVRAIGGGHADFEDTIQLFSALHVDADCILTRDTSGFAKSSIPAITPARFLAQYTW